MECSLGGFCQPVSATISNELENAGIGHVLVSGYFGETPHHWIEFPQWDNAILDPTASQFGDFPPIWFPADPRYYSSQRDRLYIGSKYVEAPRQVRVRSHRRRSPR